MIEHNSPEKLLYYSKIDKYCVDVILKNTFAITDPTKGFNDPFDCFLEVKFDGLQKEDLVEQLKGLFTVENYIEKGKTVSDLSEEDSNKINNYRNELTCCTEEILKQRLSEYATKDARSVLSKHLRIRSFSAQPADRTLNNIMFSHYGDSHKGLCYIFDSNKLIQDELITPLIEVKYLPEPASVKYKSPEKFSDDDLKQIELEMVRIKYEDWKYENEWRLKIGLLNPSENINDIWEFEPDALEGIVLGLKATKEDEERIKTLVEKRSAKVNIYKTKRKYGSFYLDYENNKIN